MEDYLKAIYRLQRDGDGPVTTSALADALDNDVADGIQHARHARRARDSWSGRSTRGRSSRGTARLSHSRSSATTGYSRRISPEQLGFDWTEVHDEADRLEHHISGVRAPRRRSAQRPRGRPTRRPHPERSAGTLDGSPGITLAEQEPGDVVVVERVSDRDPEELAYLSEQGITPDQRVEVLQTSRPSA